MVQSSGGPVSSGPHPGHDLRQAAEPEWILAAADALKSSAAYIGTVELGRPCRELRRAAGAGEVVMAAGMGKAPRLDAGQVARYLRAQRQTTAH
jgi:hypothetical protein